MSPETLAKRLGPKLLKARKKAGLNQSQAAILAGVARTELVALEKGYRTPRLHQLVALAKTYKVPPGDFLAA
jgi:transcriptional regulator with XRE-family HTH domain